MTDQTPVGAVPSVHAALAAVADDVRSVRKSDVNEHQRFNFRGIDSVLNAVGPAFRAHGVVCLPQTESLALDFVTTTGGKASTRALVHVRYRFYGPAGDFLDAVVYGESWDTGDKATAKAYSVAYRTALLQTLTIPTDEPDPDSVTFEQSAPPAPAALPTDSPEMLRIRTELIGRLKALGDPVKAPYNAWRTANGVPALNRPGMTRAQTDAVSDWIDAYEYDTAGGEQ